MHAVNRQPDETPIFAPLVTGIPSQFPLPLSAHPDGKLIAADAALDLSGLKPGDG